MFQPAGWVGDASPRIHQDCSVTERGLRWIIEWHVEPRRQMTSRAYVAHKMVESHKVATLAPGYAIHLGVAIEVPLGWRSCIIPVADGTGLIGGQGSACSNE
jgi:hypothetical protein